MANGKKLETTIQTDGEQVLPVKELLAILHDDHANLKRAGCKISYAPLAGGMLGIVISYEGHKLSASNGIPTIDGAPVE